jgi:hypothetical protein
MQLSASHVPAATKALLGRPDMIAIHPEKREPVFRKDHAQTRR